MQKNGLDYPLDSQVDHSVFESINFFTEYDYATREEIYRTNAHQLTLDEIDAVFRGTYRGIKPVDEDNRQKIIRHDKNAEMLMAMYLAGWDFKLLICLLARINYQAIDLKEKAGKEWINTRFLSKSIVHQIK